MTTGENEQTSLFRQQAIQAKTDTLGGEPSLASPPGMRLIALFASASALAMVLLVVFGTYTRKETVSGIITTTEANVRLYPEVSGTISEMFVGEGDSVTQGDHIARISTSRTSQGNQSVQETLLRSMNQELASVRKQMASALEIGKHKNIGLDHQIDNVLYQLSVMQDQRGTAVERLELAQKNDRRLIRIREAGLISEVDIDTSRAQFLDLKLALSNLDRDLATQGNVLERLRLEKRQLPAMNAARIGELDATLERLAQRIFEVRSQQTALVTTPIDGRVSDLGKRVGQHVSIDTPIVAILPNHASYAANLYVPSHAIGFVHIGTEVRLRYDAFPHQKFGAYGGTVVNVGSTPIRPHEADTAIRLAEPSYLLRIRLDNQHVAVEGAQRPLSSGMTLQADIVQDRRRIIEWLFDPLVSAVKRTQ